MFDEIVEQIQKDIQKDLDKIKLIKKMQNFNKKYKDLFYQNNKLTSLGACMVFLETFAFSEALINIKNGDLK